MGLFSRFTARNRADKPAPHKPAPNHKRSTTTPPAAQADQAARLRAAVEPKPAAVAAKPAPAKAAAAVASPNADNTEPTPRGFALNEDRHPAPANRHHTTNGDHHTPARIADHDDNIKPLRNKQELFDELQRNYREVVRLVRKVDTHLDTHNERSDKLAAIATRLDRAIPAIERLGETPERIDALRAELNQIVQRAQGAADERAAKIERVVKNVVDRLESQALDQQRLVATMAEFRETMGELATTNRESGAAVRELARTVRERDTTMNAQLGSIRTRVTVGLALIGAVAIGALAVAVFG